MSKKRKNAELDQVIEENKGPVDFKADENREIPPYGQGDSVEYKDAFIQFMSLVLHDSQKDSTYDFSNVGSNLIFYMQCHQKGDMILERDYDTESVKLRETYQALIANIKEIRKTTSTETLELPVNHFVRSIDTFLEGVLERIGIREVLSGNPISSKSIVNVSLCHDCLTQTYEMLNEEDLFVLGDIAEA